MSAEIQQFEQLYQEHLDSIYRFVYSHLRNREVAEDLTSHIFLKAVRGQVLERSAHSSTAWLFRVAHTTIAGYWRAYYRQATHSRLSVAFRDLGGLALGLLQDRLDLQPSQKVRTSRLIPDALCQPPDDRRRLAKGCLCLRRLANYLIQPSQRRLDLPTFCWHPQVCSQP